MSDAHPRPIGQRARRELRYLLVNVLLAVVVGTAILAVVNARVVTATPETATPPSSTSSAPSATATPTYTDGFARVVLRNVPPSATGVHVSFDDQYCVYLDQGVVHIRAVADGREVKTITEAQPINYLMMYNDADLLVYFYNVGNSIHPNTYNITSDATMHYQPMAVAPGSVVVNAGYSVATALLFVVTRAPGATDVAYRINANLYVSPHALGVNVVSFIPSATSTNLYYQDSNDVLYYDYAPAAAFRGQRVALMGRDAADDYYVLSLSTNQVSVVTQTRTLKTFAIPPGALNFYSSDAAVYAVYPDSVVDLTTAEPTTHQFGVAGTFVAATAHAIYLLPPA